jgi:hypothetical protein
MHYLRGHLEDHVSQLLLLEIEGDLLAPGFNKHITKNFVHHFTSFFSFLFCFYFYISLKREALVPSIHKILNQCACNIH